MNTLVIDQSDSLITYGIGGYDKPINSVSSEYINDSIIIDLDFDYKKIIDQEKINRIIFCERIFYGQTNRKRIRDRLGDVEFINRDLLALYASRKDKGLVIDINKNCTRIVPIYDSYILEQGIIISSSSKNNIDIKTLAEDIIKSISKSPIDLRKILYQNMLVIENIPYTTKIGKKIVCEIRKQKKIPHKLKILAPRNRNIYPWIGGSIYSAIKY